MGFADRYIRALSASNLKDDELNHQAEPLLAAGLASCAAGDLGAMLHRAKYAGTAAADRTRAAATRVRVEAKLIDAIRRKEAAAAQEAACRAALDGDATTLEAGIAQLAPLLQLWTAEVVKRGRARRWVPENTAWDADAAQKLYRQVAEHSLAYWLDDKCAPCGGTGIDGAKSCKTCAGSGRAELAVGAGFVREHTLDMASELANIAASHTARAAARLRENATEVGSTV